MMPQPFPPLPQGNKAISFSSEETTFKLQDEGKVTIWLRKIIEQESRVLRLLNFIFCSDDYLHRLNLEYLHHDTLTDVITFPYADPPEIEGDIFISIDRVQENALEFSVSFGQELLRVMVHGLFHLCGYGDKTKEEELLMRKKEDEALSLWLPERA